MQFAALILVVSIAAQSPSVLPPIVLPAPSPAPSAPPVASPSPSPSLAPSPSPSAAASPSPSPSLPASKSVAVPFPSASSSPDPFETDTSIAPIVRSDSSSFPVGAVIGILIAVLIVAMLGIFAFRKYSTRPSKNFRGRLTDLTNAPLPAPPRPSQSNAAWRQQQYAANPHAQQYASESQQPYRDQYVTYGANPTQPVQPAPEQDAQFAYYDQYYDQGDLQGPGAGYDPNYYDPAQDAQYEYDHNDQGASEFYGSYEASPPQNQGPPLPKK